MKAEHNIWKEKEREEGGKEGRGEARKDDEG